MDNRVRVLIVDDEEDFLKMIKYGLEERGDYFVECVSNPHEVIDKVSIFKPHIILLDLIMPSIGGLEVCEMLNKNRKTNRIPIIILSALTKSEDKLKAYKLGVVDYLTKPVIIKEVVFKIEKALQSYKTKERLWND